MCVSRRWFLEIEVVAVLLSTTLGIPLAGCGVGVIEEAALPVTEDTTPPATPAELSAELIDTDEDGATFALGWTEALDEPAALPVARYIVTYGFTDGSVDGEDEATATSADVFFPYHGSGDAASGYVCVAAVDGAENISIDSACATVLVPAAPAPDDVAPPIVSGGQPSGTLASGTTETTMSISTDEAATCKWGVSSASYASLPNTFSTTGGTSHSTTLSGLIDGQSYARYVRCEDAEGHANGSSYTVSFDVASSTPPVGNHLFFNSSEPGCGTDPDIVFCDDFEDGDWYVKDCDQASASGGFLQTDGWCGSIYANPITPAGAGSCGGAGVAGTDCAASGGALSSGSGGGNMAMHELSGGPYTELWARWYHKTDSGYQYGAEKNVNFTKVAGDITWFNIQFNCGAGGASSTATPSIQILHGTDVCQGPNVSGITLQSGRWYFYEVHVRLNSSGTTPDGLIEMWINDCGTTGVCTGTPTLRTRMQNVAFDRNQSGCLTSPCEIDVLWFENWANPGSTGTGYFDQIKVSRAGPVGFMH
jgi:hypothetical protein